MEKPRQKKKVLIFLELKVRKDQRLLGSLIVKST